ncbi:Molybdate-anion transporter [Nowakowskiella sp. JEL0407]|nr:Molybdate-anion transporter [Nowakowskiella sp. JEL0407]
MSSTKEDPLYLYGFILLVAACIGLSYYYRENKYAAVATEDPDKSLAEENEDAKKAGGSDVSPEFSKFKVNYLIVYSMVMFADWLQGSYIYPLYREYKFTVNQIAILFVVGFLSSAVFGTFIGSVADKVGRRKMCIAFCVIYGISCITKYSPSFTILLFGRVTGGIATSLLFSVFEAWMVNENFSRGFSENSLSDIFSWSTFMNGLVAIFSGVVADFVAKRWGNVAPFGVSLLVLICAGFVISGSWKENYGSESSVANTKSTTDNLKAAVVVIQNDPNILAVGVMQSLFESAMYTFVFLWPIIIEQISTDPKTSIMRNVPWGIIFSAFMVSIMIGSVVFRVLTKMNWTHEKISKYAFGIAMASLIVPVLTSGTLANFMAFNLFEFTCGLYFPSIGTLRGKFIPEEMRATIMNVFRIPLNLIVVVLLMNIKNIAPTLLFGICTSLVAVSFVFARRLENRAK